MYCKKCGNFIDDDLIYCTKCGTKQNPISSSNKDDVINSEQIIESNANVQQIFGNRSHLLTNSTNSVKISKYDTVYQKEIEATIFGIILLVVSFITISFGGKLISSHTVVAPIFALINIIIRLIVTIWVVNIANRQNRDKTIWGMFSFFLPSIALIIIGLNKKLIKEIVNNTTIIENEENESKIKIKPINQTSKEDFLGSTFYWVSLIGITLLILMFIIFVII